MAQVILLARLSGVGRWPDRKLPQQRFDEAVQAAMNQMSVMVDELNDEFIPAFNQAAQQVEDNANSSNAQIEAAKTETRAYAEAAKQSETACRQALDEATSRVEQAGNQNLAQIILLSQQAQNYAQSAESFAGQAQQSANRAEGFAGETKKYSQEAKEAHDDLLSLAITVEESANNPGFALIDRQRNMLRIGVPKPEKGDKGDKGEPGQDGMNGRNGRDGRNGERGPQGPAGDITTALDAQFIQFVVDSEGNLCLNYTGADYTGADFSISEDGYLEVDVNA